jgi:streptogramin lyase
MVNLLRRRLSAAAPLSLLLAACAGEPVAPAARAPAQGGLLTPWLSIHGGWRLESGQRLPLAAGATGQRIQFVRPVGVAARGDVVLVADAGARTIWRLDRTRDGLAPFAPFSGSGTQQGASLQIGPDFTAWVALPAEGAVVQYDARGREVRRWRNDIEVPRPVAMAVPDNRSEIVVAEATLARIVQFDPSGHTVRVLDSHRAVQSVSAMAFGPGGLYVLDRQGQQVVVIGARGEVLQVIGENRLVQPRAMAVDRSGRVFVSDDLDQQIKVFRGDRLLATAGGTGAGSGRFGRIEALAVDENLLYVADSMNARVQVMMIAPQSMEPQGSAR